MSVHALVSNGYAEQQSIYAQNMQMMLQAAYRLGKIEQGLQDQKLVLVSEHQRLKHEITHLKTLYQTEKETLLTSARNQVEAIGVIAYKITTYIQQELDKAALKGLYPGCHDVLFSAGRKLGTYQSAINYRCDYEQLFKQTADFYHYYSDHPAKSFFQVGVFDLIQKRVIKELNTQKGQAIQISKTELPLSLQPLANQLSVAQKIEKIYEENAAQSAENTALDQEKQDLIKIHAETIKRFKQENLSSMQTCLNEISKRKVMHEGIVSESREKCLSLDTRQLNNIPVFYEHLQYCDMSKEILTHLDELVISLNRYIGSIKI